MRRFLALVVVFAVGAALGARLWAEAPPVTSGTASAAAVVEAPGTASAAAVVQARGTLSQVAADRASGPTYLPVLNFMGSDDVCRTWLAVQNIGSEPTKAILLTWTDSGSCPPDCRGVHGVECSGLIAPGSTWNFLGAQIPTGSASGLVLSANASRVSSLDPSWDDDDIVADYLCEAASRELTGDCEETSAFLAAYSQGGEMWGLPLAATRGARLAVTVLRHCPGDAMPGTEMSSSYGGIAGAALGDAQGDPPYYKYASAGIRVGLESDLWSIAYIQNAGLECANVELRFQPAGRCGDPYTLTPIESIAPGETAIVDLRDALGDAEGDVRGTLTATSSQPLAIAIDSLNFVDVLLTHTAMSLPTAAVSEPVLPSGGASVLGGPALLFAEPSGETMVHVANLEAEGDAVVSAEFFGPDGESLGTSEETVCAGGSHAFLAPDVATPNMLVLGSVRVESSSPAGTPGGEAPRVAAMLEATRIGENGRNPEVAAAAYNLLSEPLTRLVHPDDQRGTDSGVALIGIPLMPKDLDATGVIGEIAITNMVPYPGTTDTSIRFYDQNGLVWEHCLRLGELETVYVDMFQLPGVKGYEGAAVVSATFWEHEHEGSTDYVGLAAAQLLRTGASSGFEIPGDELAMTNGFAVVPGAMNEPQRSECGPPGRATATRLPPRPTPTPDTGASAAPQWGRVQLPILNFEGMDDVCHAKVLVTNESSEPSQVLLVMSSQPGFCPPNCAGPTVVECSGLLAPGGEWEYDVSPIGSPKSGALYSLTTKTLNEIGAPGGDTVVADHLCQVLSSALPGNCNVQREFQLAYDEGTSFSGVPMAAAYGGALSAVVERKCPGDVNPAVLVESSYQGLPVAELVHPFPAPWRHSYYAPYIHAADNGLTSVIYVQNADLECASVVLAFKQDGERQPDYKCSIFQLSPGETYQFEATDCVGPDWIGSAVLESEQMLALAVDQVGNDTLSTQRGFTGDNPFDLNFDGLVDELDTQVLNDAMGSRKGEPNWNRRADLDGDGFVGELDRERLELNFSAGPVPSTPTPTAPTTPPPTQTQLRPEYLVYLPVLCHE